MLKQIRVPKPIMRAMLIILALIMLLVLIEVGLRIIKLATEDYNVWIPNSGWRFEPHPDAMPGVEEGGVVSISPDGLRGEVYDPDLETIHILTLGGSTTECLYLDQASTWPELMANQLSEESGRAVWIGNAARSAMRSPETVLVARYLLPQLGDVDYVIATLGANDMILFLRKGPNNLIAEDVSRGYVAASRMHRTFNQWPNPLESKLQIIERLGEIGQPPVQPPEPANDEVHSAGEEYIEWRMRRQNADHYLDAMPDLDSALAAYRVHLEALIQLARKNGSEMVFVTQPAIYAPVMTPEAEARLWFGHTEVSDGPNDYYASTVLLEALEAYNRELLDVCRDHEVLCVDAASAMNGDLAYFYDDVHFSYAGAEALAKLVSDGLVDAVRGTE